MRLTCSVISSSEGMRANASARAEARSRARCSSSRKIFPSYSLSPSQTALPPWTAESNGLTAALVAVGEPAAHVDDHVAVALIEDLKHGISLGCDAVAVQAAEVGQALVREGLEAGGQRAAGGR